MIKLPNFKKMSKREKLGIIIGAPILFLVLTDRLVLSPWWTYINKIRIENKKLEKALVQQKKILSRKDMIMGDVETYSDYLKPGESPEMEMANFLRKIEDLGEKNDVDLDEIKPLESESFERYQEFKLEVHYSGDLLQCIKFIYAIDSYPALYVIERLVMGVDEQDPETLKGTMRIKHLVMI